MKNSNGLKRNWTETKRLLKQKIAMLSDSDRFLAESKRDEILSRLQIKLGKTKEELHKIIETL